MLMDPLVPRDFGGWFGRIVALTRREFGRLAGFAAGPAVLTAAYVVALSGVKQSPDEMKARFAQAAASSPTGRIDTATSFGIVFGRMLPIMLTFMVLMLVVGALYEGASFYVAVRRANGQATTVGEALRFALPRMLPFIGWSLLGGLVLAVVLGVPVLPGILAQVGPLIALGALVSAALGAVVVVTVFSSLFGVVLLERGGISRCRELIKGRFWATAGRMLITTLIYLGYSIVAGLIVSGVAALLGGGVISGVLQAVVMIPALVFQVAANLVTYAELRFHQHPSVSTRTLAAELIAPPALAGSRA